MMKVKVIRNFRDKYNNNRYKENEELEITEERFEEINSTSYGILVEEVKEEPPAEPPIQNEKTEDPPPDSEAPPEKDSEDKSGKVDTKKKSTKK